MRHLPSKVGVAIASLLAAATIVACSPAGTTSTTAPAQEASGETTQSEATATPAPAEATATPATDNSAPAADTPAAESSDSSTAAVSMTKLNLNTVTADELLATIPGFGNRMVREFQEYRPYSSIQQFRREIGKYVDDAQVAEYEQYVYVPVNVNEADADTLMQLPGMDEAKAQELIAGRPYASNDAFLEKLATLVTADEAAAAKGYLEAQ